jgi:hypothetical protein
MPAGSGGTGPEPLNRLGPVPTVSRTLLVDLGGSRVGLTRKLASVSSLGMIDYRSDKERIAKYTRQQRNMTKKALKQGPSQTAAAVPGAPAPAGPGPSWQGDPTGRHEYRWWTGNAWADQVSDGGTTGSDPIH